jgi:hypothetical protein
LVRIELVHRLDRQPASIGRNGTERLRTEAADLVLRSPLPLVSRRKTFHYSTNQARDYSTQKQRRADAWGMEAPSIKGSSKQ